MTSLIGYETDVVANYLDSVEYDREFQMHFHDIYEIYYFVGGDADYFVEGKPRCARQLPGKVQALYHPF